MRDRSTSLVFLGLYRGLYYAGVCKLQSLEIQSPSENGTGTLCTMLRSWLDTPIISWQGEPGFLGIYKSTSISWFMSCQGLFRSNAVFVNLSSTNFWCKKCWTKCQEFEDRGPYGRHCCGLIASSPLFFFCISAAVVSKPTWGGGCYFAWMVVDELYILFWGSGYGNPSKYSLSRE